MKKKAKAAGSPARRFAAKLAAQAAKMASSPAAWVAAPAQGPTAPPPSSGAAPSAWGAAPAQGPTAALKLPSVGTPSAWGGAPAQGPTGGALKTPALTAPAAWATAPAHGPSLGGKPAPVRRSGAPVPPLPGGDLAGLGRFGVDMQNQARARAAAPKPAPAPLTPIQQELRLRQTELDEARNYSNAASKAQTGDWWARQLSATDYLTGGGARAFGENVAHPAGKAIGQGVSMTAQTLKNQGVRGAGVGNTINSGIGQWGKWLTAPWSAPKPLSPAEQQDYKNLQSTLSLGERRLTPEELSRVSAFDKRQRAFESEQERQQSWDAYSTQAVNDSDKAFATAKETTDMLDRGDSFDGLKAEIVKGPNGQQRVALVPADPILREKQRLNDQAGGSGFAGTTLGGLSNVAYGMGDAAADAAPYAMPGGAIAPLGRAGVAGALGGAGLMLPGVIDAMQSGDEEAQMGAGRNLTTGATFGAVGGQLARGLVPSTATASEAPVAAAAAAGKTTPQLIGNVAKPVAAGAGMAYVDSARQDARQQAVDQASGLEPNPQAIAEQQQATMPGNLDANSIPPAFAGAAASVNAGTGTGQVGTPAMGRPDLGPQGVVNTEEDADFYDWMKRSNAYRTADGKPGAIETKALEAGQSAYNNVFQSTGSKQQALEAQQVAYRQAYTGAYQKEQATEYETSAQQLEKLFASNAKPEEIQTQAQKTMQHLVRSDPKNAEQAKQYTQWLEAQQRGEPIDNPAAVATDEEARKRFAAQAAAAAPATGAQQNSPGAFGQYMGGLMDQFNNLPTEAKAAIGIGLPLALVGMLMNASGESGGLGGILFTVLGLGAAGLGAAGSGLLGDSAQQMVGSGMGGLAKLFGAEIPKDGVDLSALLSKDVVGDITAQGGGDGLGGKAKALWNVAAGNVDIESKLKQVDQLKQLTSLPSFIAIPLLRSLDPKNIQTAEQAQMAYNNAMKLRQQLDDPKSQLTQMINQGRQLVDFRNQAAAGVDTAKGWLSNAKSYIPGLGG